MKVDNSSQRKEEEYMDAMGSISDNSQEISSEGEPDGAGGDEDQREEGNDQEMAAEYMNINGALNGPETYFI